MKFLIVIVLIFSCSSSDRKPAATDSPCYCSKEYVPVCGFDGLTYANECAARCEKVKFRPGECQKSCPCEREKIEPVCANNGYTYKNICYANCLGLKFKIGACQ